MKSVVSLVLVIAVVISAVPIAAQEWIDPAVRPIHWAMANTAFRFSLGDDLKPSVVNASEDKSGQSDWSRVRDVEGEEITLTVHGSPPGKRWGGAQQGGLVRSRCSEPDRSDHPRCGGK